MLARGIGKRPETQGSQARPGARQSPYPQICLALGPITIRAKRTSVPLRVDAISVNLVFSPSVVQWEAWHEAIPGPRSVRCSAARGYDCAPDHLNWRVGLSS